MTKSFSQFWAWYRTERRVFGQRWLPPSWGSLIFLILFAVSIILVHRLWSTSPSRTFYDAIFKNPITWLMILSIYVYNRLLDYFRHRVAERTGKRFLLIPFGNRDILQSYAEIFGKDGLYKFHRALRWIVVVLFVTSVFPVFVASTHPSMTPAGRGAMPPADNIVFALDSEPAAELTDGGERVVYSIAYVVTRQGIDLKLLAVPLVLISIALLAVRLSRGPRMKSIAWIIVILGGFLSLLLLLTVAGSYLENSWRYTRGHFETVEGTVGKFHPMPYRGHDEESFSVNGVDFSYSDFVGTSSCFKQTASHGGPIRDGLRVRIAYVDNCILRLEVAPGE